VTNGYDARLVDSLSTADVAADLEWFVERGGRLGGTPAEADAAAYIVRRLQEADIDAGLDTFETIVSYSDQPEEFGPAAVVALAEPPRRCNAKSYAFGASTPEGGLEGELVYVGNGSPGDYDRFGVDARGRFALSILNFDVPHSEPARVAQERPRRTTRTHRHSEMDVGKPSSRRSRPAAHDPGRGRLVRGRGVPP
jgi:hypothetical protein